MTNSGIPNMQYDQEDDFWSDGAKKPVQLYDKLNDQSIGKKQR